jgi:hypothetical protein
VTPHDGMQERTVVPLKPSTSCSRLEAVAEADGRCVTYDLWQTCVATAVPSALPRFPKAHMPLCPHASEFSRESGHRCRIDS